jgi:hypothetical protein
MARALERVRVLVLHPDDGAARPCTLRFSAQGVVLESVTSGAPVTLLRVPWRAIEGLSADGCVRAPDGTIVQALDLATDRGELRLAMPAPEVTAALSVLATYARRWRCWRYPASRLTARFAASASGACRGGLTHAGEAVRASRRRPALALVTVALVLTLVVSAAGALSAGLRGSPHPVHASVTRSLPQANAPGIAGLVARSYVQGGSAARLPRASAPPPPAPASIAESPALSSHEVFGFVPYWTLADQASFDVGGFTTLAYFSLSANADGTLEESGTGWDGYESQAFADLVARAHAAGVRVVLSVNCFSLPALEVLTSSRASASVLGASIVAAIVAKHLDGVNLDFEGGGAAQRAGLTALVASVAGAVHAVNPHFQVTVDTYGSAASDPESFYDVRALASVSDGLFVMAYGLNYGALPTPQSPITSSEMSDVAEAAQYASTVPPSKVIFGTSYFGYSWATTNGTMAAHAVATGTPVTYAQLAASGHPIYWDPVTQTAWTSYETGGQWYEDYVSNPASVYLVAQLAQQEGFRGVGVWALGMDGNDPQMTAALDGKAPPQLEGPTGPAWTTPSTTGKRAPTGRPTGATLPRSPTTTTTTGAPARTTTTTTGVPATTTTTTTAPSPPATTTTTAPSSPTTASSPPGTATAGSPTAATQSATGAPPPAATPTRRQGTSTISPSSAPGSAGSQPG